MTQRCRSAARPVLIVLIVAASLAVASSAHSQSGQLRYQARLSPVPVESTAASTITGKGSATATLAGNVLTITGTFEGMQSAATMAQIHMGQRGVRGPVEFDLEITKATAGSISGSPRLSRVQIDSFKKGWYYIQIHSEKAPEGNLWGWLLPLRTPGDSGNIGRE